MPKFKVVVEYQGYVRGQRTYRVEADTPDEAERNYRFGELVDVDIIRNDTSETGVVFDPENLDTPVKSSKMSPLENIIEACKGKF